MTNDQSTVITADQLSQELRTIDPGKITVLMPVGALTRRVSITAIEFHAATIELLTAFGETLTFPTTDKAEVRRHADVIGDQAFTRYELTFPMGAYFALIVGPR